MRVLTRMVWIALAIVAVGEVAMVTRQASSDGDWFHMGGDPCTAQAACNANR
jgi:hypothetical protein